MIELINADYADFVNLSTNLVNLGTNLSKLDSDLAAIHQVTKLRSTPIRNWRLSLGVRSGESEPGKRHR